MVINLLAYGLIIRSLTLVDIRACFDLYHQAVKVRKDGKTETLNLVYEPEMYEDTEGELKTDTEGDIREESEKKAYSEFVLTLSDVVDSPDVVRDGHPVEDKVAHLSEAYAADVKHYSRATICYCVLFR